MDSDIKILKKVGEVDFVLWISYMNSMYDTLYVLLSSNTEPLYFVQGFLTNVTNVSTVTNVTSVTYVTNVTN